VQPHASVANCDKFLPYSSRPTQGNPRLGSGRRTVEPAVASALLTALKAHIETLKAELETLKAEFAGAETRASEEAAKTTPKQSPPSSNWCGSSKPWPRRGGLGGAGCA
jgi:hypothetical protein